MHITKPITTLFLTLLLTLVCTISSAQITPTEVPLETRLTAYRMNNGNVIVALSLDMEKDWYTYANDPGGMGKPTKLTGTTASGAPISAIYPKGIEKPDSFDPSVMINAYKSGTQVFALITAEDAQFPLALRLELLLCHPTKCVPVRRDLSYGDAGLDITSLPAAEGQPWWPAFIRMAHANKGMMDAKSAAEVTDQGYVRWDFTPTYLQPGLEVAGLLSAIFMGLLAGLILNIMPCVLPVVSLKLSALLNSSATDNEADRIAAFREHNIFFALGVLAFFLVLAIVLGATGQAWGALFQKQWLVLAVAGLVFALALSLFGLFHLPVIDLKFGVESKSPRIQAFFTGNLTTLLATPCSGPFLGGVLSWALIQGPLVIAAVFISIGIGMSSPYLLMVIWPGLSRFLPKSGPWIVYVEKGIAFFLVGTAFYLVSLALGGESLRILAPLWAALLGGWLWKQTRSAESSTKWTIRFLTLVLFAGLVSWTTPTPVDENIWEEFNPVELSQRIGEEKLFVDFTADWCPTCKVLEATVLTPDNVTRWKKEYGIAFIKVDMTERDLEAEALLRALGSMSIPTAALFSPGEDSKSPLVLRDLFTESQLENILESWEK
ncbi:thioredoxin family protein [Pseudodesulfovibrio sp.]|nr:thioredoxin family protein [Pseudodesulfovibrio sp.]